MQSSIICIGFPLTISPNHPPTIITLTCMLCVTFLPHSPSPLPPSPFLPLPSLPPPPHTHVYSILMCDNDSVKISDFGTSRTIGEDSTRMTFAGTVGWMSPEMLRHDPCSEKVDVWSYAVLLWEMLTQEKPYSVRLGYHECMSYCFQNFCHALLSYLNIIRATLI